MPLYSAESLVGVIVRLLYETQLLTLRLVQPTLHTVGFLEALKGKNEQLGVMLIVEGREWDGCKLAAFEL
jgi:hypothetical protein